MVEQEPNQPVPTPAPQQQTRSRIPALVWVLVLLFGIVVVPFVACFGLGFAVTLTSPASTTTTSTGAFGPSVGVIRVEGPILEGRSVTGFSGAASAGSETIIELIERAENDPNIRAVVLRINSPGGGVAATEQIYNAITQMEKPLVVSMGTTAASGGYYIAAPADYIYANTSTLTGSIGVISQFVTAEELLDEVGVEVVFVTSGDLKDFGAVNQTITEEELEYWQEITNLLYEDFVDVVVDGRGLSRAEVIELADGRVFTGEQAVEAGLVDEVGYFEDAIQRAADLGGISGEPRIFELSPEPTFLDAFLGVQTNSPTTIDLIREFMLPRVEYRMFGPQVD